MKTKDVIKYFGTQVATAQALGMAQSSIASWDKFPPDARQLLIEKITRRKLVAEPGCLDRVIGYRKKESR